ncbi:MAG: hypothetical protein IPL46_05650 [Saprospiraceae bacterium]|nr:hypothetical protein [Saprospiraceae bacterium]
MDNIEIQYPLWYVAICLLIGLILSAILYFRASYFPAARTWIKGLLAFCRFLAISVISLLLLSPVLKYSKQESKKPIVIFGQDESASIQAEMDSVKLSEYKVNLNKVIQDVSEKFEVKTFGFGESFRPEISYSFQDKSSNLSAILEYVADLYGDQNLGAIIFATDGIFNEGKDPRYANLAFSAPIYTIALGDTTPDRDLSIRQIFHNNIAYLSDKTSIQVDVNAYNCQGARSILNIYRVSGEDNRLIQSTPFNIDQIDFFRTIEIAIPQESVGLQRFRVVLNAVNGEKSLTNNRKDFFIDVIDARQKILILAASPHPDLAALTSSLEKNKNYQIETAFINKFSGKIADYDFVVLHQLPARGIAGGDLMREINDRKVPRMIVVGSQTNIAGFNQYQQLVSINPKASSFNEVQAIDNKAFSFFKTSEEFQQKIAGFPPMDAPFGDYSVAPGAEVLLKQRIGKIDTDFPLLVVGEENGVKNAILCAEGLWRWKFFDHLQNDNNQIFDELLTKTVQYVSLKEDKRKFRVFQAKNLLAENEDVLFDAELYNQSYQLVNEPEVNINIVNSVGEAFTFAFSRKNEGYYLDAGRLPVDDYSWIANTQFEGERLTANGQLSLQAIEKENYATVADHHLLAQLAAETGGALVYPDSVSQLTSVLISSDQLKPVYYRILNTRNAIHLKSLFFLLLSLLVLEWGLRRYLGTY